MRDHATYQKDRYQTLRAAKLCLDCKGDSPTCTRCPACRTKRNTDKRVRRQAEDGR